jgi:hypothetical protein
LPDVQLEVLTQRRIYELEVECYALQDQEEDDHVVADCVNLRDKDTPDHVTLHDRDVLENSTGKNLLA